LDANIEETAGPPVDPGRPPSGLKVKKKGDETRIQIGVRSGIKLYALLFYLSIPAIFGWIVYNLEPDITPYVVAAVSAFLLFFLSLGRIFGGKKGDLPEIIFDSRRIALYAEGYHMLLRDLRAETPLADIAHWIADRARPLPSGADRDARARLQRLIGG